MPKQKPSSVQNQENTAKEYKKLPSCTIANEQPHDHDSTTSRLDEKKSSRRKWRLKPYQRAKKKSDTSDHQQAEVLVSCVSKEVGLEKLQKDVDEVVEIVRGNVEGILEREGKVEDLQIAAEKLHDAGLEFKKTGRGVRWKYWWNNNRCCIRFLIGMITFVIFISLVAGLTKRFGTHDLTSATLMTNVTTEPLFNVSSSVMPTQITPSVIDRNRTGFPPDRRGLLI
eukprot:XP_011674189.1 PREDICTED: uncharacterized protein LOC105443075 [Strongylocentrotus purpuratus]